MSWNRRGRCGAGAGKTLDTPSPSGGERDTAHSSGASGQTNSEKKKLVKSFNIIARLSITLLYKYQSHRFSLTVYPMKSGWSSPALPALLLDPVKRAVRGE